MMALKVQQSRSSVLQLGPKTKESLASIEEGFPMKVRGKNIRNL